MEVLTGVGDVREQTNFRLAEIDNIHKSGDILHYDLSFQGAAPSITASSRIGLMDSTVPGKAIVGM